MIQVRDARGRLAWRYGPRERILKASGYYAALVLMVVVIVGVLWLLTRVSPELRDRSTFIAVTFIVMAVIFTGSAVLNMKALAVLGYNEEQDDMATHESLNDEFLG